MSISLHALGLFAALASVAIAATVELRIATGATAGLGFAVAVALWWGPASADPAAIGLMVAGLACFALFGRLHVIAAAFSCGLLAGIWGDYLVDRGVPIWAGLAAALLAPTVSTRLARNTPGFLPTYLREESQVLVAALGILVAVVPQLTRGWKSAADMNLRPDVIAVPAPQTALTSWVWPALIAALVFGGGFTLIRAHFQERAHRRSDMLRGPR